MKTQTQRIITACFMSSSLKRTPMALLGRLQMLAPLQTARYFTKKTKNGDTFDFKIPEDQPQSGLKSNRFSSADSFSKLYFQYKNDNHDKESQEVLQNDFIE